MKLLILYVAITNCALLSFIGHNRSHDKPISIVFCQQMQASAQKHLPLRLFYKNAFFMRKDKRKHHRVRSLFFLTSISTKKHGLQPWSPVRKWAYDVGSLLYGAPLWSRKLHIQMSSALNTILLCNRPPFYQSRFLLCNKKDCERGYCILADEFCGSVFELV